MLDRIKTAINGLIGKKGQNHDSASGTSSNSNNISSNFSELPKSLLRKQMIKLALMAGATLLGGLLMVNIINNSSKTKRSGAAKGSQAEAIEGNREGKVIIEVASKALDPERMWRNHFEDKLVDSSNKLDERLKLIADQFNQKKEELERTAKAEADGVKQQLEFARKELKDTLGELQKMKQEGLQEAKEGSEEDRLFNPNVTSFQIEDERNITRPKSARHYIPETAYVTGILLGGINVSTSVGSKGEPVPVIIRITGTGNLPKSFDVDVKNCRILGSSYGDLSSERAIIRAEVMSCHDPELEQIITTKVAGIIFGEDGVNGIKGRVVQTSNKQVQHALVGGLISGFANTAKSGDNFTLTGIGAVKNKTSLGEKLKDNSLSGVGNAGEKLADYYLRQAEAMSPVLQIPRGTRVDIVFTKGVYIGSSDVRERIENGRTASSQN